MKRTVFGDRVGIFCLAAMVALGVSLPRADAGDSESDEGEKQVGVKDLPSAVRAAAERVTAGGVLKRIVVEREGGRDAYSVEASMAGKNKEFTFAADGSLLEQEEDVDFAQLPESVRAAAEKYFGGGRGLRASMEIAKGVTSYDVGGRKGGKEMSLKLSASGARLEEEEEDKEEEEEAEDQD